MNCTDISKFYAFLFFDSSNQSVEPNYESSIIGAFYVLIENNKVKQKTKCEVNIYCNDKNEKSNILLLNEGDSYSYGTPINQMSLKSISL